MCAEVLVPENSAQFYGIRVLKGGLLMSKDFEELLSKSDSFLATLEGMHASLLRRWDACADRQEADIILSAFGLIIKELALFRLEILKLAPYFTDEEARTLNGMSKRVISLEHSCVKNGIGIYHNTYPQGAVN